MSGNTQGNGSGKQENNIKMAFVPCSGGPKSSRASGRLVIAAAAVVFVVVVLIALVTFLIVHFSREMPATRPAIAKTKNGVVHGRIVPSPQGTLVHEYLGIPFAQAPIGKLRYADPQPVTDWDVLNATDHKYSCIQTLDTTFGKFEGSNMWNAPNPLKEDCLYLHIWTPVKMSKKKRDVMVWIFGGGFYSGSSSLWVYDGKALAAHQDIVVASFNYRVGTFGFLSTGDNCIKGNFGLKDQRMAMKWIKENIAAFGGDPEKITIFGESAGASSVAMHMMSPKSESLFKRAIMQSGAADSSWSIMSQKKAQLRSAAFLKAVSCQHQDTDALLQCLRALPADKIRTTEWVTSGFMEFPWVPVVDGDFLTDTPYNLWKAGKVQKKEVLLGTNKDEGTFWILYSLPGFSKDHSSLQTYDMFLKGVEQIHFDLNNDTLWHVKQLYTPNNITDKVANRDALDKVAGDRAFTCPTRQLADNLAKNGIKIHLYYFTHRASNEVWPPWMGMIHGADIQWIFGMPMNKSRGYTENERKLAEQVMSYWANFARTGDPNGAGLPSWPAYTSQSQKFVEIEGPSSIKIHDSFGRKRDCELWNNVNRKINEGTIDNPSAEAYTKNGLVRGRRTKSPQGTEVQEFLGIPFAKPPVGNLRYADPKPAEYWGKMDATNHGNSCVQKLDTSFGKFAGSNMWNAPNPRTEDCLNLHIWSSLPLQANRAVMVWIYGGGFYSGSNSLSVYDGKAVAAEAGVIMVTINYRVGSFGFLSTGDGRIRGNFGMKDQVLALQWIKDNIAAFGGNPKKVTVFGGNSGGASVALLMLSPSSQHLFQRAIMQSSAPDAHWAFMSETQAKARSASFFKAVKCQQRDQKDLLECLRKLPYELILKNDWVTSGFMNFPWVPTVDGEFLSENPYAPLESERLQHKDVLLGANKNEGTLFMLHNLPNFSKDNSSEQTYDDFLKGVDIIAFDLDEQRRSRIKQIYSATDRNNKASNREALDMVSGDRAFACPAQDLTRALTNTSTKSYYYYLTYRASNEVWPPWMGVLHSSEIQWVFGMPFNSSRGYTAAEKGFSRQILTYWTNFAKTGDPNGPGLPNWPRYQTQTPQFLELGGPSRLLPTSGVPRPKHCTFWRDIRKMMNKIQ